MTSDLDEFYILFLPNPGLSITSVGKLIKNY
ncbi:MAG: hypothetical protein JWR38_4616 [Mucilaginibacter sp.]|nr:hypothetical protein [Mucilaginibacter sp.]